MPRPLIDQPARRRPSRATQLAAGLVSVGAHGLALLAVLMAQPEPRPPEPEPIAVDLVQPPPPPPPEPEPKPPALEPKPEPTPARPPSPAPPKPDPKPPTRTARPAVRPPDVEPLVATPADTTMMAAELGEADLAGATTVGTGSGNGAGDGASCDMVRRLQAALRRNPRVRSALASAHGEAAASGKAVLVWRGKWLQSPGQVGKGLAGVREAIIMEVGFAPAACRADLMRGLVVVSLADGPGAPRLALGDASWRWSDLLFAPGTRRPSRG
jgi:hypothetical protein